MSISSSTRKAGPFACNGSTVAFPFAFKVFTTADVRVVLTDSNSVESDLALGTNYTVALNADQDANPGGTVTTTATYATGYKVTLTSQVQNLQPVTLTNQGGFYPQVINNALDRLTIMAQQLAEQVGRAVKTSISSSSSTPDQLLTDIGTAVTNASNSATAAAGSATNSANSATASANSATASAGSATAAANSATQAAASAASIDVAAYTHAAASKATPVDVDELPISDSAASWGLKKLTWANIKIALKTYFDALYATSRIQSIAASVASNALTLTLNQTTLDFRSSSLNSGTVNTRNVGSAVSLVVPSGATLGTASGQAARLILLAVDNAGTVELAVANLAGGINLDETTLISTTAISGASNSASTIYSTTARSNVPFRVIGFIDITEATAGTWASAPTVIQGQGGQALTAMQSLGYGQSVQDVTASRAFNTTYYNTTGKPIFVSITAVVANGSPAVITVGGVSFNSTSGFTANANAQAGFIVPPGIGYSISSANMSSIYKWIETR